mgnify:CR=1 FL=1
MHPTQLFAPRKPLLVGLAIVLVAVVLVAIQIYGKPAHQERPTVPVPAGTQVPLPPHRLVGDDPLLPKQGRRIQVNVDRPITREECRALIAKFRPLAAPDGQVGVQLEGRGPLCVDNLDRFGVSINDWMFE